jgi:hypothetical protein
MDCFVAALLAMTMEINPPALRCLLYLFERDEALPLIGAG